MILVIVFAILCLFGTCSSQYEFIRRDGKRLVYGSGNTTFRFISFKVEFPFSLTNLELSDIFLTVKTLAASSDSPPILLTGTIGTEPLYLGDPCPNVDCNAPFVFGYNPREFNEEALCMVDRFLHQASLYGVKVVLPLFRNQPNYNHFALIRGFNKPDDFYKSSILLNDTKFYLEKILQRRNTMNGLFYKDDPTIAAWQIEDYSPLAFVFMRPPVSWAREISSFIKSIDSSHLVMYGLMDDHSSLSYSQEELSIPSIDIYTEAFKYKSDSKFARELSIARRINITKMGKAYITAKRWFNSDLISFITQSFAGDANATGLFIDSLASRREGEGFAKITGKEFSLPMDFKVYLAHYPGFNSSLDATQIEPSEARIFETICQTLDRIGFEISEGKNLIKPCTIKRPFIQAPKLISTSTEIPGQVSFTFFGVVGATNYKIWRAFYSNEAVYDLVFSDIQEITSFKVTDIPELKDIRLCPIPVFYSIIGFDDTGHQVSAPLLFNLSMNPFSSNICPNKESSQLTFTSVFGNSTEGRNSSFGVASVVSILLVLSAFSVIIVYRNRQKKMARLKLSSSKHTFTSKQQKVHSH